MMAWDSEITNPSSHTRHGTVPMPPLIFMNSGVRVSFPGIALTASYSVPSYAIAHMTARAGWLMGIVWSL